MTIESSNSGGDPAQHNPGGKRRLKLAAGVHGGAVFSPCGFYRYSLSRSLDEPLSQPYALWIETNPSTADAHVDDPTVQREWSYTRALGYRSFVKMNISAYRLTDMKALKHIVDERKAENFAAILTAAKAAERIIFGFGVLPKHMQADGFQLAKALAAQHLKIECLALSKAGWPRHPLYMAKATQLKPFDIDRFLTIEAAKTLQPEIL